MQIPLDIIRFLRRRDEEERKSCPQPPPPGPQASLDVLDEEREQTFRRALLNVLSTDVAEFTYSQLLDGLPTVDSLSESYPRMRDHPVHELEHVEVCDGYIEKAREMRSNIHFSDLALTYT